MTTATVPVVRVQRTFNAAPERVFDAWLDANALAQFMRPGDKMGCDAVNDPRVGGKFSITMLGAEGAIYPHSGEYLTIDRPRKLVFTWHSKATAMARTEVTVDLRSVSGGKTELTLTHVGIPQEEMENHNGGWTAILALLEGVLRA
jgi:uncharacterized protein YndB with AHSA1/START domain